MEQYVFVSMRAYPHRVFSDEPWWTHNFGNDAESVVTYYRDIEISDDIPSNDGELVSHVMGLA